MNIDINAEPNIPNGLLLHSILGLVFLCIGGITGDCFVCMGGMLLIMICVVVLTGVKIVNRIEQTAQYEQIETQPLNKFE